MSIGLGLEKKSEAKEREQKHLVEPLVSSDEAVPHEYLCPITIELMTDPVVAADGHTYERAAITAWFKTKRTSPQTNKPVDNVNLRPNIALRKLIDDFKANRKTLQARYRQMQLAQGTLQLLVNGRRLPLQQSFINLALLHQADAKEQKQRSGKDTKEAHTETTPVKLSDLFTHCADPSKQQVLVLGGAGMGKSTLCRYIAHEWAARRLWADRFQWVFRIPLRHLNSDRYPEARINEVDLLRKECLPDLTNEDASDILNNEDNILWILDGVDEMPQPLPPGLQALWERLKNKPHVIMTSRPQAIAEHAWPVRLEISGFTQKNTTAYIDQFFKQTVPPRPELAASLQQLLASNANFYSISQTPIQLEILCSLWEEENQAFKNNTDELTLSQLYQRLTLLLLKRQLNKDASSTPAESSLLRRYRDELAALEQVAFSMMQHQQVVLSGEKLMPLLTYFSENDLHFIDCLMQLGFLKYFDVYAKGKQADIVSLATPESESVAMDISDESGKDEKGSNPSTPVKQQDYYFIHLTFQEYFAARHLATCLQEPLSPQHRQTAVQFINQHKYDNHYKILFGFVAGLLSQQTSEKATQALKSFWQAIDEEPREWSGRRHLELVLHCLNESVLDKRIPNYENRLKSLHAFIQQEITTRRHDEHDKYDEIEKLYSLLKTHRRVFHRVLMEVDGKQMLLNYFASQNDDIHTKAFGVLETLGPRFWEHPPVWKALLRNLELNKESFERITTLKILQKASPRCWEHQLVWEVMLELFLNGEHPLSHVWTLDALQASGPWLWEHQSVLEAVIKHLEDDKNEYMRYTALKLCQASGPGLWRHQSIWERALKLLDYDKTPRVNQAALEVLQASAPQLWEHQSVLEALLKRLQDQYEYRRYTALKIFQASGPRQWEHRSIWEMVLKLLEDKVPSVRIAALTVLQALGARLWGDPLSWKMILKRLKDNIPQVRQAALEVFQASGPQLWENQSVWETILKHLKDNILQVCHSALRVLRTLGPRLWEHQFVSVLTPVLEYLENKNKNVRYAALEVLKASGPQLWEHRSAWEAILKKHREDEDMHVRGLAFQVLSTLNLHLQKHELISGVILEGLESEDKDRRKIALQVLDISNLPLQMHESVLGAILKRLENEDKDGRKIALQTLRASNLPLQEHESVLGAVLKCLKDEDRDVCELALRIILRRSSGLDVQVHEHESVLEAVLRLLEDEGEEARGEVLEIVKETPNLRLQVRVVLKCLEDEHWFVRMTALHLLKATVLPLGEHPPVLEAVVKCLDDEDELVCCEALEVVKKELGAQLWKHQSVLEAVLECMEDEAAIVRNHAFEVLTASGLQLWEHRPAWEAVLKYLENQPTWEVMSQAQDARFLYKDTIKVLQGIPLLPVLNYLAHPDTPLSLVLLVAKIARLQNVSFYIADKALWFVDQKGTTRVDLPWEQAQGQLQKLLATCQQLACEQGLSDFISSAVVKKPEVTEGMGLSASPAAMDLSNDEKAKEAQQPSKLPHHPTGAQQNTSGFFTGGSRKRGRSAEPAASASASSSSSSSSNPNTAASLPSASAQTHTPMETDDEQSVSATSHSSAAAANESGEPAAKKARREGPKP